MSELKQKVKEYKELWDDNAVSLETKHKISEVKKGKIAKNRRKILQVNK